MPTVSISISASKSRWTRLRVPRCLIVLWNGADWQRVNTAGITITAATVVSAIWVISATITRSPDVDWAIAITTLATSYTTLAWLSALTSTTHNTLTASSIFHAAKVTKNLTYKILTLNKLIGWSTGWKCKNSSKNNWQAVRRSSDI